MNDTPHEVDDTTLADWKALAELQARIAELTGDADAIKGRLRANLKPGTYSVNGAALFAVQPNRRFDVTSAVMLLDDVAKRECVKVEWDAAKVKAKLTGEQIDACMLEVGDPKIVAK